MTVKEEGHTEIEHVTNDYQDLEEVYVVSKLVISSGQLTRDV